MHRLLLIFVMVLFVLTISTAFSAVPTLINYQGLLTDAGGNALDTTASVTFSIFTDSTGGSATWSEIQSVTSVDGIFNVLLGNSTPIDNNVINSVDLYLEVQLGASPFSPRTRLVSYPYSIRVATVDGASGGSMSGQLSIGSGHTSLGIYTFIAGQNGSAYGDHSTVGGGLGNTAGSNYSTVSGGTNNQAQGPSSTVSGGNSNGASDLYSTIGGGYQNIANGFGTTVSGGNSNSASFGNSTVSGGSNNSASADYSTISGGYQNNANSPYNTIGGGRDHTVNGPYSGISSGFSNTAGDISLDTGVYVGGGYYNSAYGEYSTITGGMNNVANGRLSSILGGVSNTAGGTFTTVGGGSGNNASGQSAFIGCGELNVASGIMATIAGGYANFITGSYSTIPGGLYNRAPGNYALAAGTIAKANHSGAVVISANTYALSTDSVSSSAAEQMVLRADGGYFLTNVGGAANIPGTDFLNTSTGAHLTAGGTWTNASDKNSKENFSEINVQSILKKISDLEITEWNYKKEGEAVKHIGPVAQDFYDKFGLGTDDKSISTVDASGIALAAIKALYQENQELKMRLEKLESKIK